MLLGKRFRAAIRVADSSSDASGNLPKPMPRPPRYNADNVHYWRDRCEKMRALGEEMKYPETRAIMFRLVKDCEELAKRAETRASSGKRDQ